MAQKLHPFKAKLEYGTDGVAYTALTDVRMLKPPGGEHGDSDITVLESVAGWKEYMASWKEGGEVPFEIFFHKTAFAIVFAHFNTDPGSLGIYYRITFNQITGEATNGSRLTWQGYHKKLDWNELSTDSDDAVRMPCSIKVSGAIAFSAGA